MKITYSLSHLPSLLLQQEFISCSEIQFCKFDAEINNRKRSSRTLKFNKNYLCLDLSIPIKVTSLKKEYNPTSHVSFPTAFLENNKKTGVNKWGIGDSYAPGTGMATSFNLKPGSLTGEKRTEILPARKTTFQKTQTEKLNIQNENLRISPPLPHLCGSYLSQL